MSKIHKFYVAFMIAFATICFYAVGAWADILWARCTDGKTIKQCKLTTKGLYINGKLIDAYIIDVIEFRGEINILYKDKTNVR